MITDPDIVFGFEPRHGLVARSGWEQDEARAVLRDLGWEWEEELHALVPPDNVADSEAGVQAVQELHRHGHRAGYAAGPYGAMRLTLDRAEQILVKLAGQYGTQDQQTPDMRTAEALAVRQRPQPSYGQGSTPPRLVPDQEPPSI